MCRRFDPVHCYHILNMHMNHYAIELDFIRWSADELIADMQSFPDTAWYHENGYANRYIRPQVSKPLYEQIWAQIPEFEGNLGKSFYAELAPKQLLPPHIDVGRTASINFPLIGDWTKTPVRWHSSKAMTRASVIHEHCYASHCPTIINTTELHSAYNVTDETRYLFCVSVYLPWEEIQQIVEHYRSA